SYGPFEIDGGRAREMLLAPLNPNKRPNSDIVRPWTNGRDITRRPDDRWIVFFPDQLSEADAELYEEPYRYVRETVVPYRNKRENDELNRYWWRLWRARPDLFSAARGLSRMLVTPRVSKHRIFVWRSTAVVPDSATVAIVLDDDTT